MNSKTRKIFALLATPLFMLAIPLLVSGSAVTIPNTFVAGTVADASQVNANFAAVATAVNDNNTRITTLETGKDRLFASNDSDGGGTSETAIGQKLMNTVNMNLPSAGFLLISGHVFINNGGTSQSFSIVPKLDGVDLAPSTFACLFQPTADATGGAELFSLNYTITTPVTAGAHTVTQTAGPNSGTTNWFHNAERLTVLFVATGSVTSAPSPLIAEPTSPTGE